VGEEVRQDPGKGLPHRGGSGEEDKRLGVFNNFILHTLTFIFCWTEHLFPLITEAPLPLNVIMAINYSIFLKGVTANFEIDSSIGVEASQLYPEVKYTTVEEYLSRFV